MKQATQTHYNILVANTQQASLLALAAILKVLKDAPDVWVPLKPNTLLGNLAATFNKDEADQIREQQLSKNTDHLIEIGKVNDALKVVRKAILQTQDKLEQAVLGER